MHFASVCAVGSNVWVSVYWRATCTDVYGMSSYHFPPLPLSPTLSILSLPPSFPTPSVPLSLEPFPIKYCGIHDLAAVAMGIAK